MRLNKIDYSKLNKILIIRPCKIGDIVISSFVFSAIKKFNRNVFLELITLNKNREVLQFNPHLDRIYFINQNIFSFFQLLPLRKVNYDLIIDLNDNPSRTSDLILRALKSQIKLGFDFLEQRKFLDIAISQPSKDQTHLIERYAHLLRESGLEIDDEDIKPEIYLNPELDESIKHKVAEIKNTNKLIGINISAGAQIRKLPPEKWIAIVSELQKVNEHIRFMLLYEPNDSDKALFIKSYLNNELFFDIEEKSFQGFACKIKNLDLLMTPDTSAVHIASALNVPMIALYPNVKWNFVSFAPYKTKSISLISSEENINAINKDEIAKAFAKIVQELNWKD